MEESWVSKWNERYAAEEFAYGDQPNNYFREQILKLKPGSILLPAEGEGRNAVYAAGLGWQVYAFDLSPEGQKKAYQLAAKNNVTINYQTGELQNLGYKDEQFDAIALIYAHFPADIKSQMHRSLDKFLKKGGTVIFEAFSKSHLDYLARDEKVGGPKDIASLFSTEEIRDDFPNYEIIELEEKEITLSEGLYHNGKGSVIRFTGRKKSE